MYLNRIIVPNYRGLQGIELEFDRSLSPSIFPVTGINGSGKSTLLQLLFVLLYCVGHPHREKFARHLLSLGEGLVATIDGVEFYADGTVRGEVSDRRVFLVSPAMRSFLFLDRDDRQLMALGKEDRYAEKVDKAAKQLPNFIPTMGGCDLIELLDELNLENAIVLIAEFGSGWHPERCYNVTKELGDRYP